MVGGPDGHRGPVTKTTLVVWWSLGISDLSGGGCEGVESVGGSEFLFAMFILGSRVVIVCTRPRRRLASFLFEV
jgi:hypothetical protein